MQKQSDMGRFNIFLFLGCTASVTIRFNIIKVNSIYSINYPNTLAKKHATIAYLTCLTASKMTAYLKPPFPGYNVATETKMLW